MQDKYTSTSYPEIQCWTCKECENDMNLEMYAREPEQGLELICNGCDREVFVEGEYEEILV
jgi:hypothetical protein|tara:strand:+ start:5408 stop:5590 length:183 start_codon:yes stop_codon:yes gene_type:complete